MIIEKHFVKFTFKLTFVYTNVTESDYIMQRTPPPPKKKKKKKQESPICLIKDYFVMKLNAATIYNISICKETASSKKLPSHEDVFFETSCSVYVA